MSEDERIESLEGQLRQLRIDHTYLQIHLHSELTVQRHALTELMERFQFDTESARKRMTKMTELLVHQKLRDLEETDPETAMILFQAVNQSSLFSGEAKPVVIDEADFEEGESDKIK